MILSKKAKISIVTAFVAAVVFYLVVGKNLLSRRTFAAQGPVAAFAAKYNLTEKQALQFLTWDANKNQRGTIESWVPTWWINNAGYFPENYAKFSALSDEDYKAMFAYLKK